MRRKNSKFISIFIAFPCRRYSLSLFFFCVWLKQTTIFLHLLNISSFSFFSSGEEYWLLINYLWIVEGKHKNFAKFSFVDLEYWIYYIAHLHICTHTGKREGISLLNRINGQNVDIDFFLPFITFISGRCEKFVCCFGVSEEEEWVSEWETKFLRFCLAWSFGYRFEWVWKEFQ